MSKKTFEYAISEIAEGFREGLRFMCAFTAAPFVVWMEFVTNTGQWAPRQDDTRADSGDDRTGA
jgi:hypothetical protein